MYAITVPDTQIMEEIWTKRYNIWREISSISYEATATYVGTEIGFDLLH